MILLLLALTCGVERQDVKVLKDHPIIGPTVKSSITLLRTLVPPATLPIRRLNVEKYVVEVQGTIAGYKLESDGDIHIVLENGVKGTIIIESAAPSCAPTTWQQTLFTHVRNQLRTILPYDATPAYRKLSPGIPVVVEGFVFFDKIHGQTGVAPNGVEIHPIISIQKVR